jgi:hypothetical protein
MRMQLFYNQLDAQDRKVYAAWLKRTFAFWALISVVVVVVCTVLALDASTTLEQRIAMPQQSVALP